MVGRATYPGYLTLGLRESCEGELGGRLKDIRGQLRAAMRYEANERSLGIGFRCARVQV